jgi:hypothetical protein
MDMTWLRRIASSALLLLATASHGADWPQFGRTPAHLDTNPGETAFTTATIANLHVAWAAHFGNNDNTEGGAAIANGRLFVAGFDGRLSAFDLAGCGAASCEPLWQGRTRNDITATPAVADGRVYIGSADRFLHVFAAAGCGAAQCDPLWRGRLQDAAIDSSVTIAGGVAYLGDYGGRLYAFDAHGCGATICDPLWTAQAGPDEQLVSTATVGDGFLFIQTTFNTPDDRTGRMLAFRLADCSAGSCVPTWSADLGGPSGTTAAPLVLGHRVYVGSGKRFGGPNTAEHLFSFATQGCGAPQCSPQQVFEVGFQGLGNALAIGGGWLLASTDTSPKPNRAGVVMAFDLAHCGARCKPTWTGVNSTDGFLSAPVVVGDLVLVGKGPAFNVDAGVLAYPLAGCGAITCEAIKLVIPATQGNFLGAPLAVGEGRIVLVSNDNTDGHSNAWVLGTDGP